MKSRTSIAVARGVRFLLRRQLASGEFPTLVSSEPSFSGAQAQSNVFTTAVVLHALRSVKKFLGARAAARKAIQGLKDQRDPSGFWVFWGASMASRPPEERIPPDMDCSAHIASAFKDWDAEFPYETHVRALSRCRDANGLFGTWIYGAGLDWHPAVEPFIDRHDVDPVVNANAAYLFYQHGEVLPEVERYLENQISGRQFHRASNYYCSPAVFLYAFSKLVSYRPRFVENEKGEAFRESVTALLAETNPAKANSLEKAMALSAAAKSSIPFSRSLVQGARANLREAQAPDGGWAAHPFHSFYFQHYGSRELTTALAVEALALPE